MPPSHIQVLVVGGGPSGSYAASVLAREGLDVAILEADKFPRYHVGESLIPSIRHHLRFIGAEEKVEGFGFVKKPGAAIKFNQFKREGYTDFVAIGANNNAWNVVRSEFDQILLDHARELGVRVCEQTKVTSIEFSAEGPVSAAWVNSSSPMKAEGVTTFDYFVDATGRAGLLSTKYLKNRHYNSSLKNIAVWGYWKGAHVYGKETNSTDALGREGSPWFEALTDESGWAWFIPLHNETTSIGVVMNQEVYNSKLRAPLPAASSYAPFFSAQARPTDSTMIKLYFSNLCLAPKLVELMTRNAQLVEGSVKSASDFSYSAKHYAGERWRIVGDAGAFIDPFFSSGIHLAMTSALSASATICASLRGDCTEKKAAEWHTRRVATSYTRFQIVVLSAYKQIRAQTTDVLSDVDEDNFDRAFAFLRPVIQGAADLGTPLSESELQRSLDFCVNLFNPTTPEQHQRLSSSSSPEISANGEIDLKALMDVTGPVVDPQLLRAAFEPQKHILNLDERGRAEGENREGNHEAKLVLDKINARRLVHPEYAINNMKKEELGGFVVRLQMGNLGLVDVKQAVQDRVDGITKM